MVDDRILFHPEVILVFNELTADVVVLLMEFQLLVKLDRTAFQTLVVVLLMLFHPEDMLLFNAFTADTAVLLMAFQQLLKLLLTALHVLAVVFCTLPQPEEMLDFMELTAAFTEADPLCIAWLIPVQLWLTAVSTPAIALVIAAESVVDRPFAAVSTKPTLLLMPSASPCMKSGIQLSKSASGPSSGTEKCRKERILSATLVTAEATLLMQDLIPFTIPLMISAPQENACPASPLMKDTALLKSVLMVEVIPLIVVETADFTLFQMVVTPVRMPFMAVDTADFAALKPVVTTDLIPLTTVLTADLIPFQTEVTTDLMPFITVVITDRMAFQTVDTTV